ncbi:unnamed protein product [Thelazia callipaeda]|uniref:SANT domain-containing protein n=1 Tax=Thelazia callipaeda TaxID=103827 RepID=A0A0N5CLK7_THECL|nr:unnamed protein product [Thelazia callipaeda]
MFPTGNPAFTSPSQNNPDNSVNLAALYLHPSLGISNQAYTQFYQQAQGQAQLAQHQQLQRHFEQLVAVRAAQNAHAQLQAFQVDLKVQSVRFKCRQANFFEQQQAFQNQQVQVQSQQKLHAAHQQNQAQAVHMQRFNALRQSGQHLPHSHAIRDAAVAVAGSRQELQVEVDARRRRSLIADFMIAPNSTPFLDGRGRSDSINSNIMGETRKSEAVPNEFVVITDETTERKKNSITDRLEAVEKEKKLVDNQITIIQRKKEEYESELAKISNDNEDNDKENDDIAEDIDSMSLVERIYAENRKKTVRSEAHIPLSLAPISGTVPQYRNPWDSPLLKETIERYKTVKPFLVKMLTESRQNELLAQKYYADKYNIMYAEWLKKDEKYCKSQKKIARDEKHREIFERTFPEIRKAREERERCGRIGMSSEQLEQDEEYKRRRAAAVLPPMMLSSKMRNGPFYEDLNGVVSDALESHNTHIDNFLGKWSDDEKQIFKEQIGIYGKNFAAISEFLDRKDVKDCVLYYYLTKKRQNYKALLGKKRKKPPRSYKPPVMPRLEEIAQKAPQDANDITIVGSRELECCICKTKVNSGSNTGRIITRLTLDASGYDASSANEIDICVCQKCKAKGIKPKTVTRCQIGICHNPRRKVKPTRPMPAKWKLISDEQRLFLMHQMLIPEDILKCCPACHKKISKQLDMIISGELNQEMDAWLKSSSVFWNNDELKTLLDAVESMDIKDWNVVAEKLGNRYSVKQCQEQYEKVCEENVRKELESEDDGSEDDRENSHSNRVAEIKSVTGEIERDPSVESSSTLTPDEVVNQGDCVVLFPTAAKSPSTHLYKPRFRGTAGAASEGPNSSVDNSLFLISSSKKEPEVALAPSPLAHQKSDASASSSEFSNLEDCKAATLTSQSSVVGSALFATLTSSTPDPTSRSSTQIETDKSSQSSISVAKSSTPIATQTLPSTVSNAFRGSITQGTPVMRPLSPSVMRSPSGNDLIADKLKQIQMFSTEAISAGSSLVAGNNILAPSVPSVPTPTLQPNANVAAAAAAFPFLQNPLVAAATAFPNAASDPNISPFTAFYNQFTTLDPTMQVSIIMKFYKFFLFFSHGTFIDQYRQQALGLSLPEQQQLQSNQQQQINALANDQAKYLLWLQIMQQSTNVKLLQQQQQAASQTMNLQRTPTPNTLLSTLATPASVRSAVASHFSGQQNTEHQQQTKQGIATTVSTNLPGKVATDNTEQQRTNIQTFCTSTTQLYNDFHNAEQMRKEHDENARQMEAQQKRLEEIRYIEQQRRRVLEVKFETLVLEEARINDELSRISQIDYPRALRSQDSEAVRSSLQAIERLKERRTAMQHYLRAYDEGLKSLSTRSGAVCSGPSGVIVKGASDERIMTTAGLVSKGAVKEFPPSVSRNSMQQSSTSNISSQGLIGIKRTLNDSALAVTIEGRVSIKISTCHCPSASSLSPATSEANVTSRRSRADSIGCRKGLESNMFDSGQASLMYRSNSHNITDDELSRGDQRNIQSGGEMRRKSGIHTVYLPSLPDVHHTINAKTAAGQKLGNSQTVTGASRHSSSISHSQSFASSSLSRPSLSQQLHHFPHFIPALPQHQARFSTPQSISTPGNISSHVLPSSTVFGCPVVGPANYSSGVHTSASTFISPRTPVSINLNLTISHPAHAPLHNASNITIPAPVASSPFQVSVLEPPSNTFLLTIANSLKFQPLVTADSSSPKFQPSILVPGIILMFPYTGVNKISKLRSLQNEERTVSVESQQRSESRAFINYEPLSPDTADAVPTTQTDTSTEEASNLPLFSFLNLPDNGNGALSTSTIQPAVSSLNDSQLNARQTPTASVILPQLPTAVSTGIVVSGSTMLPSKPPPQPTYEPLSDDD